MECLEFEFSGEPGASGEACSLAGVVGSGNLEVMIEPDSIGGRCRAVVNTPVRGFEHTWQGVLNNFFAQHPLGDVLVTINDGGATPAVVTLRLEQAAAAFTKPERPG